MRYRGSDDDTVGFGHFSEVRKVKTGPLDTEHDQRESTGNSFIVLQYD